MAAHALAQPESLSEEWVVARAIEVSPTLAVARDRIRAARAQAGQVGELSDPMVMARAWGLPMGLVSGPPDQLMVMAQQTVPLSRVRERRTALQETRTLDAELEEHVARHAATREASLVLVSLWEALERTRALGELSRLGEQLRDVAIATAASGRSGPSDVAAAEAELGRTRAMIASAEAVARLHRSTLRVLLALPASVVLPAPAPLSPAATVASLDVLLREARDHRPELRSPAIALMRARAMGDLAESLDAPDLTAGFGYMRMDGFMENAWMLEVGVSLPVWRTARDARRDEAVALGDEARDTMATWQRAVDLEVTAAYESLRIARTERDSIETLVAPATRVAYDAALAAYSASGDVALVLDRLRSVALLELERVAAAAFVVRAEVELAHAAGGISRRREDHHE